MEADFARYYPGVDFLDYHRGRLSLRRVLAFVRWLPPEAAVWVATERARQEAERAEEIDLLESIQNQFQPRA